MIFMLLLVVVIGNRFFFVQAAIYLYCGCLFCRTSCVKVYGTKYARGCVVVVALHHGVPIFGKVEQVLIVGEIVIIY